MALDYTRLRPTEVARVLNANTPADAIPVDVRAVRRHQNAAGLQIGEDGRIHLLRYAAWLRARWRAGPIAKPDDGQGPAALRSAYDEMKEKARRRNAEKSAEGRDIGELPAVADSDRRAAALKSLEYFCRAYLAASFTRPFCKSLRRAAAKLERAIRNSGSHAYAMPRAFGKSTLSKAACLWAILTGHRKFGCLIGAAAPAAEKLLSAIKKWAETNDLLLADFPEVFFPIRRLDLMTGRAPGQRYQGNPTYIQWASNKIVFPTMPDSAASGSVIFAAGLCGSDIRGQAHTTVAGATIRPDFVLLDDPQTRETARSPMQTDDREEAIMGDVMGMADAVRGIAVFAAVTVICKNDLASRLLDRKRHPEFQGERTKLVPKFPTNTKLWDEYARLRADSLAADGDGREANEFYLANRAEMDAGAEVADEHFYFANELSALQHAMNLRYRDARAFAAESQNEPEDDSRRIGAGLSVEMVAGKINSLPRGSVALRAEHLTAFIDCHKDILFWVVAAWESNFTGYIIDYGTEPRQPTVYFSQAAPPVKLSDVYRGESAEAVLIAGIDALEGNILGREWIREDGAIMRVARLLKDSKWQTEAVKSQCRRSRFAGQTAPSQGWYLHPNVDWPDAFLNKPGGRTGYHWRLLPPDATGQQVFLIDADFWKSFISDRMRFPAGDPGGLSLFGDNPREHEAFAEQWTAQDREWRERGEKGKWHWIQKPGKPDDHYFDCVAGVAAAAATLGVAVPGIVVETKRKRDPSARPSARQAYEAVRR
jgi:hypothetical protein